MRAGMNPALEERLRRVDPTVALVVDAIVEDREDVKKEVADWAGADSLTGLTIKAPPQDVGVELSTSLAANLTNTTQDGDMTDLDGPPSFDGASPFFTALVVWGGTEPDSVVLQQITARLDPDTGGGKNVNKWILQVFAIRSVGDVGELDLVPIMNPVQVTAGASAGEVAFNLQGLSVRPKMLGAPLNGGTSYPAPSSVVFIWAVKSDGTPASNVAWNRDSVQPNKTTSNNTLSGLRLTKGVGARYLPNGTTGGLPYITLEWSSYTTATITFSAGGGGNNIDLGAAPSNDLMCILRGFTPGGTSFKGEIDDGSAGFTEFTDGDLIGVDNTPTGGKDLSSLAEQQAYDIRVQLITNSTTDETPKLTELGVAEVTITDFANLTSVSGGQWAVDPVTLKGFVTQIQIAAIRDGVNDYRDKITTLFSENDIGKIRFRLWWGAPDLDRNKWFLVDAFNVRDYDPSGAAIVVTGVSALAKLKAILPVVTGTPDTQPLIKTNVTLEAAYDDIIDGQLGLDGKYRGPGIEDNTTTVTKEIADSDVKAELDALCRLGRGCIIPSQGRVKFVQMFDDGGAAVVVFAPEELSEVQVLPGFRERRPEHFVRYDYDFDKKRYKEQIQITHATAISKLGLEGLSGPPFLDDVVARWIDTQALAEQTGQDTVKALATGLLLWSFKSTMPYPELEPGDRVAVPTDRFVAKDPLAARALRGHQWAVGRVVQASDDAQQFAVWIQSYTDIFVSETAVTVTKFANPEVLDIALTISASGVVTAVIQAKDALGVRVSVSTSAFPSLATVQGESAQALDGDRILATGTLDTLTAGETFYISVLAYETAAGGGSESANLAKARIAYTGDAVITSMATVIDRADGSATIRLELNSLVKSIRYKTAVAVSPSWPNDAAVEGGTIVNGTGSITVELGAGTVPAGQRLLVRAAPYEATGGVGPDSSAATHGRIVADLDGTDVPEILGVDVVIDNTGAASLVIRTVQAGSIKASVSTSAFPVIATVQGESSTDTDSDGLAEQASVATLTPNESLYVSVLAYAAASGGGVEGPVMAKVKVARSTSATTTEAIEDGWSSSQNASSPENGDEALSAASDTAYSNLENANTISTDYNTYHSMANAGNMPSGKKATLTLSKNDGPASSSWTTFATVVYSDTDGDAADQLLSFTGAMGENWDLRAVLTYDFAPTPLQEIDITMHGEDHGSQAGVQFDKIVTEIVSGTLPATSLTGTTMASNVVNSSLETVAEVAITGHEGAIDHDALTNFVSGEHFLQSAITEVGTLGTGAVPASLVTAGEFGAGNYVFPGNITWSGTGDIGDGASANPRDCFLDGVLETGGDLTVGAEFIANRLRITSAASSVIGSTSLSNIRLYLAGNFTSSGLSTNAALLRVAGRLTGAGGDTLFLTAGQYAANITTQTAAESIAVISTLRLGEPEIVNNLTGGGVITNADTLTLLGAPTEGATNSALRVVSGVSRFGGLVATVASATGSAGLNLPHGTAPTSPVDGDKWTTTTASFERINGVTKQVAYV